MTHVNNIIDKDPFFEIDDVTRRIINPASSDITIVQFDHNSERFTFRLNKVIEGHDMTKCNRIEVHYKNTDGTTLNETLGLYEITDLHVDPEDNTKAICTWLISNMATQRVGKLEFLLRFSCVDSDGTIRYAWNTSVFTGITVSPGMYNAETLLGQYIDVIEQWKADLVNELKELVISLSNDGTVIGDIITISDASSIDGVIIQNVENPETVTLARVGKNIMGLNSSFEKIVGGLEVTYDHLTQEFTLNGTTLNGGALTLAAYTPFRPYLDNDKVMTLSLEYNGSCSAEDSRNYVYVQAVKQGNVSEELFQLPFANGEGKVSVTQTVSAGELRYIALNFGGKDIAFDNYKFKIQLEASYKATEWEKFQCDTYTPNVGGYVADVTPLTPTTTLLKNKPQAIIECKYSSASNDTSEGDNNTACDIAKEDVSNAVKETVTGSELTITDLSPLVDELKVKVTQSTLDSPVIYKRIGETLWDGNIKLNSATGEYESALYPCKCGDIFDLYCSNNVVVTNITYYDSDEQAISSKQHALVGDSTEFVIPENCHYFKVHKAISDGNVGYDFQLKTILNQVEKYTAENGVITIPAPFDPVVYLYARVASSQFECEYNKDINKVVEKVVEKWELISSGTLNQEVLSLTLDGFSCSKIEFKISVASSETNPSESAMRVRTNKNSNTGGGSDDSLTRMFRTSGTNTSALILLEMYNKTIKGQLVNSGVNKPYVNYYYSDPSVSEYDSITALYLTSTATGCVFGVGTTYELWGVRK